jgi:hypothetical protein
MQTQTYKPPAPEARDMTARVMLTIVLIVSIINLLMLGYVWFMVDQAVNTLDAFGS